MSTPTPQAPQSALRSLGTIGAMVGILGLAVIPLPAFLLDL